MKRFIIFIGIIIMIPGQVFCQDTAFLTQKDFQVEKAKLQGLIYQAKKTNQTLQDNLQVQATSLDSMVRVLAVQAEEMVAHQDSLNRLQSYQSDLDDRLITQRKSGTLIAILIPAGLFLMFLILLIWLIVMRRRTHAMFNIQDERFDGLLKRLDDQVNSFRMEHESIKAELRTFDRESVNRDKKITGELEEKIRGLEKMMEDERTAHDSRHKESHTEFEKVRADIHKGYDSAARELVSVKEELAAFVKGFTAQFKELAKKGEKQ